MIKVADHTEITRQLNAVCQKHWPRKSMAECVSIAFPYELRNAYRVFRANFCYVIERPGSLFIFRQASGQIVPIAMLEGSFLVNTRMGEELAKIANEFTLSLGEPAVSVGNIHVTIVEGRAWCFRFDGGHVANIVYLQEI